MGSNKAGGNRQFKERGNSGETRNGRKSQFKNSNPHGGETPNEYLSRKEL
ncbi:hypothetical protein [Oceanobacillus sp. Castelsardo]|nr:hypothetical protein [Oceanobacillus sp. Castelsardo]